MSVMKGKDPRLKKQPGAFSNIPGTSANYPHSGYEMAMHHQQAAREERAAREHFLADRRAAEAYMYNTNPTSYNTNPTSGRCNCHTPGFPKPRCQCMKPAHY